MVEVMHGDDDDDDEVKVGGESLASADNLSFVVFMYSHNVDHLQPMILDVHSTLFMTMLK